MINHQKSRLYKTDGVDFLGFAFAGHGGNFRTSPKNQRKFKDRVRVITRRNRGVSMSHRMLEPRRFIQSWVGYFSIVPMKTYFETLDQWVRRRIHHTTDSEETPNHLTTKDTKSTKRSENETLDAYFQFCHGEIHQQSRTKVSVNFDGAIKSRQSESVLSRWV